MKTRFLTMNDRPMRSAASPEAGLEVAVGVVAISQLRRNKQNELSPTIVGKLLTEIKTQKESGSGKTTQLCDTL